jgi:iron complex outermembrane receptor protein
MSKENKTVLSRAIRGVIAASLFTPLLPLQANVLEEVVVTAQKREQSMQDVGISVSAFSGDQMKALGVTNTVEITQQVPGLQVNSWSPTLTTFNLRGISQNNLRSGR